MHPVLFELFGRPVYAYGFLLGLGIILGWFLAFRLAGQRELPVGKLKGITVVAVMGALLCARAVYLATNPELWTGASSLLRLEGGGLVAYGGYLGGVAVGYLGCRARGVDFLRFADCVAPSLAFGLMSARLGCFMNGCDFGAVTEGWWGVSFPAGSLAHSHHVAGGLVASGAAVSLPVHATQLYAAAFGLVLGVVLWRRASGDEPRTKGGSFALFLVAYAAFRTRRP